LSQTEIHDRDVPVVADHDILGLDVSVDHTLVVRGFEALGHLLSDIECFVEL
jgi:hypothetical protein